MTKFAASSQMFSSNTLQVGDGGSKISTSTLKRKTPSELRGELLKRKNLVELVDESPAPVLSSMRNADGELSGSKKSDSSKAPRYIDTRMNELFPVTKNNVILKLLSRNKNPKETVFNEYVGNLKTSVVSMGLNGNHQAQNSRLDDTVASGSSKNYSSQVSKTSKKCSKITFQSVQELSLGGDKLNGSSFVDMDKALKGLVSSEPHGLSAQLVDSVDNIGQVMPKSFCSEFHVPGDNIPLDLTLKTTMRVLSTSSVNWFHRLTNCGTSNGLSQFTSVGCPSESTGCTSVPTSNCQSRNPRNFHSWVHPQSVLPRSVIAALTSAAGGQMDFLRNRQQAWEDSFRCLYYMLRKKMCKIFYVCTEQFVVMFTGLCSPKETMCSCLAYVSQSTTNLRSLLKEHGASFSMPLCHSKLEEAAAEDLVELSEIEKYNLGQARAMETMTGIDNSPQSLLMFTGNKSVHALYDFLLNYRFFLTSLTGGDVPTLYSPVAFENAALSAPEVRCRQLRKADFISLQQKESDMNTAPYSDSLSGICYSIDITDVYLPPWVICGICNAIRSNGVDFQASFVTESTSIGLNIGLGIAKDQPAQQAVTDKPLQESGHSFDIPYATLSPHTQNAFLKGLKYSGGSYTTSISPVV
ncbi:uncharacterized protein [Primulina huaijiensis]|uniref:uncharacterized protein n=1 Tax=Primulina huaijiensis TaxID=1492673 RepID=UPI003CC7313D